MSENTNETAAAVEAPADNGVNLANLPVEESTESTTGDPASTGTLTVSGYAGPAVNLAAQDADEEVVEEVVEVEGEDEDGGPSRTATILPA